MKSLDELRKIREEVKKGMDMREGGHRGKVVVCMGTCGIAAGARETMNAFMKAFEEKGISDIALTAAGCAGFCEQEPLVEVELRGEEPVRYGHVDAGTAEKIVERHLLGGKKVEESVFG